jgi:hypothetical protein
MSPRAAALAAGVALVLGLSAAARAEEGDEALPVSAPALPEWGRGPVDVQDPWILMTFPGLARAASPAILNPGEMQIGLREVLANDFVYSNQGQRIIQGETHDTFLAGRIGLTRGVELGVELLDRWSGGGFLDHFVESFHNTFELPNADRDLRPRNVFLVADTSPQGRPYFVYQGSSLGAVELDTRVALLEGGDGAPAVTLGARLRLPLNSQRYHGSTPGLEQSVFLDLSKRVSGLPLVAYGGLGYVHTGGKGLGGIDIVENRGMVWLGLEWEIASPVSLVMHAWYETPFEKNELTGVDFSSHRAIVYCAIGIRAEPVSGLTIDIGLLENLLGLDYTADVAFMASITLRFGG